VCTSSAVSCAHVLECQCAGGYNPAANLAYPHPDRQGSVTVKISTSAKQFLCTPATQYQFIRQIRPELCMTAAGLDMNLAGPSQLQSTPGLLLTDPHSSGHGHKRQRTSNDDDDPSGRHGLPHPECAEPCAPFMLLLSTAPDCKSVSACRGQSSPQW